MFRVPAAIERFELPYELGSTDERYTYAGGSRPDGLRLYDRGLKAHSDHNTDPANGQHNAFDLVRLHKFGSLDDDNAQLQPITDRPSYKAMCKFVLELPEFQETRAHNEFEPLGDIEDEPEEPNKFAVIPGGEFSKDFALDWLIKGVIPEAELAVIYGASGTGKSFLALDLCGAIARGADWRGHRVKKPGKIVYVCSEGARGFKQRIRAYSNNFDVSSDIFGIVGDAPNMLDEKDTALVLKSVLAYGRPALIVIDTLSASIPGGDENAGKDLGKVIGHCRLLHKKTGAMVVLVHHSGKDTTRGARGWSGLRAAADLELEITRNGDFRTVRVAKMKDGHDDEQWVFKLQEVVVGVDEDGDPVSSCIVEHIDTPAPAARRPDPEGMYAKNALQTAREMGRSGYPMELKDLIEAAVEKLPQTEEGKRDTRRQQTSRAIQKLVVDGFLFKQGKDGESISLTTARAADDEWS